MSERLPTEEELTAQLDELVACGDMSCRIGEDGEPRYALTAQGLAKSRERMRAEGAELLREPAELWCLWNGKLLDLSKEDEELFRADGQRLWRARHADGRNPINGN